MIAGGGTLAVVAHAAAAGAADYRSIFTWRSWLFGWYVRVLAQVTFFALIGRLLESEEQVRYLLVGNAVMLAAMQGLWAVNMVAWERATGTLPLLVATPSNPATVFVGRGAYLVADGTVSALGALVVAAALFGMPLPWPRVLLVVPLVLVVAIAAYGLGTFLGGVALRHRAVHGLVVNLAVVTLMAICGVNVPLDVYPDAVRRVAEVLPLTHGLQAVRGVVDGGPASAVAREAALEVAVAVVWLAAAFATFARMARRGRQDGSLDLDG